MGIISFPTTSPLLRFVVNKYVAPAWVVLVNYVFLPKITCFFVALECGGRKSRSQKIRFRGNNSYVLPGVEDTQSFRNAVSWRMVIGLLFNTLLCPILATIMFSQDCFRGFFSFWSLCNVDSKAFDLEFDLQLWNSSTPILWKTAQTCRFSFRRGYCIRQILNVLSPFIIIKFLIEASVCPFWYLIKSKAPQIKKWITDHVGYQLDKLDDQLDPKQHQDSVDCVIIYAQLLAQLQVAVVLGGFIPLLLPVSCLAFWTNYVVLVSFSKKISSVSSETKLSTPFEPSDDYSDFSNRNSSGAISEYLPTKPQPPLLSVLLSIILLPLLIILFFVENQLRGLTAVIVATIPCLICAFLLFFNLHAYIYVYFLSGAPAVVVARVFQTSQCI